MADTGTPPVIPIQFQQYNSYVTDPKWQRKFSTVWPSFLAFCILLSLPHLVRSIRNGRYPTLGISESFDQTPYDSVNQLDVPERASPPLRASVSRKIRPTAQRFLAFFYWTLPGINITAGQIILVASYVVLVTLCVVLDAPLISNSNRAGFLAIAQLPVVFLFATKNSILSLLLGPGNGYEKLNYVHRWSSRTMFLCSLVHGALWIRNHLEYGLEILGEQKETSGIATFALLGVIVLTSLKPVRTFCYEIFYIVHILSMVAFFITLCYHTIYASPWIFAPLALYGLDILLRMFRFRIKDALLVPVDNQMTLIHVPHTTTGWVGGQHTRLRIFFDGRVFESHPLTIFTATPDISCIRSMPPGISFGVRVAGDWTRALNNYARSVAAIPTLKNKQSNSETEEKAQDEPEATPISVMIDGPYGGSSVDIGEYESVLLFSGGSGITFTLGLLDDIVGRCVRKGRRLGERTKRIEFAWCIRSFGTMQWFAPALMDIAHLAASSSISKTPLYLHITIYVTCLCNPEAVPSIPSCDVVMIRPSAHRILTALTTPPHPSNLAKADGLPRFDQASGPTKHLAPAENVDTGVDLVADPEDCHSADDSLSGSNKLPWVGEGGGVAVCASGPASLTRAAANAVARLELSGRGMAMGGIALHTETFAL